MSQEKSTNGVDEEAKKRLSDRQLIELARRAMVQREGEIDGETLSRIRRARAEAVRVRGAGPPRWLPAGAAVAASVVLALVLVLRTPAPELPGEELLLADSLMFTSPEAVDIELLEEPEFYQWLAEEGLAEEGQAEVGPDGAS